MTTKAIRNSFALLWLSKRTVKTVAKSNSLSFMTRKPFGLKSGWLKDGYPSQHARKEGDQGADSENVTNNHGLPLQLWRGAPYRLWGGGHRRLSWGDDTSTKFGMSNNIPQFVEFLKLSSPSQVGVRSNLYG